jgi:signal peptide peptidase SppA
MKNPLAWFSNRAWAIEQEALDEMRARLELHLRVSDGRAVLTGFTQAQIEAASPQIEAAFSQDPQQPGQRIAVLSIFGPIFPHANVFTMFFGGVALDRLMAVFRALVAEPSVSTIVLNVDSSGGDVAGVQEAADEILAARDRKRVIAVANQRMASAAYWLGSGAREIVASPSSLVGSVGVIFERLDVSAAEEKAGVKITLVTAGRDKAFGHPSEPMSDAELEYWQGLTSAFYASMVKSIARGRGITPKKVEADFGQGRVLVAADAKSAGMVDRVATFEDVLARAARSGAEIVPVRAAAPLVESGGPPEPGRAALPSAAAACANCGGAGEVNVIVGPDSTIPLPCPVCHPERSEGSASASPIPAAVLAPAAELEIRRRRMRLA